ncbi:MAG: DUF4261 domain-containing protein [Actinomycetaceae bacterium]|nr:DUF4261 domain-containing protein [Actinomycetaceae bacterium]
MEQLGISAVHPTAPEMLTAVAIYRAPIDLEAAVARISQIWAVDIAPEWVNDNQIYTFRLQGVQVLISAVNRPVVLQRGQLPAHEFHLALSFYAPLDGLAEGTLAEEKPLEGPNSTELMRRHRMVSASIVYTQVVDALLREEAAIGVYRDELGVLHPPHMVAKVGEALTRGQIPLPLWVNVRIGDGETNRGRTLGLPIFGHLDLEIVESTRSLKELFETLNAVSNYIVTGDAYLLPGQTVGFTPTDTLEISQDVSLSDGASVIRIDF